MANSNTLTFANLPTVTEFVPTNVFIGDQPTKIVWRNRLGAVKIVDAGYEDRDKTVLVIVLDSGVRYKCKAATFARSEFPQSFISAINTLKASGQEVELCVAISPRTGKAKEGFFCGFRLPLPKSNTGLISL